MINHTSNLIPKILSDELLRLAKIDRNWLEVKTLPDNPEEYQVRCKLSSWTTKLWVSGVDAFTMWAYSTWLVDGPKIFRPTLEQCAALSQIEVRLQLSEYTQPYPAILVDLPSGYHPFTSVLCFKSDDIATFTINSIDRLNDITTTVHIDGRPMEMSLQKFDEDCIATAPMASKVLRIACNACLALSNYENTSEYLYPKEVVRDINLIKKKGGLSGKLAAERVKLAPIIVKFKQDIVLHRTENKKATDTSSSGIEMPSHWRKGHWAMQPYGPGNSLRKRILRPPVFVRADKFIGEISDTKVTYYSKDQQHAENVTQERSASTNSGSNTTEARGEPITTSC